MYKFYVEESENGGEHGRENYVTVDIEDMDWYNHFSCDINKQDFIDTIIEFLKERGYKVSCPVSPLTPEGDQKHDQ
jgi:hypothetical protein